MDFSSRFPIVSHFLILILAYGIMSPAEAQSPNPYADSAWGYEFWDDFGYNSTAFDGINNPITDCDGPGSLFGQTRWYTRLDRSAFVCKRGWVKYNLYEDGGSGTGHLVNDDGAFDEEKMRHVLVHQRPNESVLTLRIEAGAQDKGSDHGAEPYTPQTRTAFYFPPGGTYAALVRFSSLAELDPNWDERFAVIQAPWSTSSNEVYLPGNGGTYWTETSWEWANAFGEPSASGSDRVRLHATTITGRDFNPTTGEYSIREQPHQLQAICRRWNNGTPSGWDTSLPFTSACDEETMTGHDMLPGSSVLLIWTIKNDKVEYRFYYDYHNSLDPRTPSSIIGDSDVLGNSYEDHVLTPAIGTGATLAPRDMAIYLTTLSGCRRRETPSCTNDTRRDFDVDFVYHTSTVVTNPRAIWDRAKHLRGRFPAPHERLNTFPSSAHIRPDPSKPHTLRLLTTGEFKTGQSMRFDFKPMAEELGSTAMVSTDTQIFLDYLDVWHIDQYGHRYDYTVRSLPFEIYVSDHMKSLHIAWDSRGNPSWNTHFNSTGPWQADFES